MRLQTFCASGISVIYLSLARFPFYFFGTKFLSAAKNSRAVFFSEMKIITEFGVESHALDLSTIETTTVTSSSLPPMKVG